jgi:hypothetical protein
VEALEGQRVGRSVDRRLRGTAALQASTDHRCHKRMAIVADSQGRLLCRRRETLPIYGRQRLRGTASPPSLHRSSLPQTNGHPGRFPGGRPLRRRGQMEVTSPSGGSPKLSFVPLEQSVPRSPLLRRGRRFQADRETPKCRGQLLPPGPGRAPLQLRPGNRFSSKPQKFPATASGHDEDFLVFAREQFSWPGTVIDPRHHAATHLFHGSRNFLEKSHSFFSRLRVVGGEVHIGSHPDAVGQTKAGICGCALEQISFRSAHPRDWISHVRSPFDPSQSATDWFRILEKQNGLQMSQLFSCIRTLIIRWFCFSRILHESDPNSFAWRS